jgi:hypothetical protein
MEPPEVLAIHAVPHPNPQVRRVGFTLDDPYVEQVWAESSAPPRCWPCGACPCCGARANQPWSTCASSASPSAWARRSHAAGAVLILVKDLHVRITTTNGEPVRDLVLDPTRDYQPQPKT